MIAPRPAWEGLRRLKLRTDSRWRQRPRRPVSAARPREIAVVGAGVAGLAAAHLLRAQGHRVTLLEAQERPGGRIRTLRDFDAGLHAEGGAFRIADDHHFTHFWTRRLGLRLEPVYPARGRLVGEHAAGAALTEDARWLSGHRFHHLLTAPARAADPPASAAGAARRQLRESLKLPAWSRIAGGMDRLPWALAQDLAPDLRYAAPVQRVVQRDGRVRVDYSSAGGAHAAWFDRVVLAVPLPILLSIEFDPVLGWAKRAAAEGVPNAEALRFCFQLRDRDWLPPDACGFGVTREGIELWQPSFGRRPGRSLLVLSAQGNAADPFAGLDAAARLRHARRRAEELFPGVDERIERSVQICWREDPWARGAQSRVDQAGVDRAELAEPEGCLHFAGEFTVNNWIDGALASAHRVVGEIAADAPSYEPAQMAAGEDA